MYQEKTIPVFVKSIVIENKLVKRFILAAVNGTYLPAFRSGSHITTYMEGDSGVLQRSYSLTNHPGQTSAYEIAIRLSEKSSGGSLYWHHHVNVGTRLLISYPKNYFSLSFKAKHHVFYAAGIGITPFLSMMSELRASGGSFELHYAAKTREMCTFYHFLIEEYSEQCHFYFSQEAESKRLTGETLLDHPIGTHVYFCGPDSFISSFTEEAFGLGYPRSSVHVERFTPAKSKESNSFYAILKNGKKIFVHKEESLLHALLKAGINAPYSCQVGRCGTCELKVVEGEIEHQDSFLTEEQRELQNTMLPCVSRAKSCKVVIDF